jgi:hypothetical protein
MRSCWMVGHPGRARMGVTVEIVKPPVVWGATPFHGTSLAVVELDRAVRLADELDRVRACQTLGDLRAMVGTLTEAGCPEDLAARADEPDDTPFDWLTSAGFLAGTWPPLPTAETLKCLHPSVLWELESTVGEVGHVPSLRHGMGFRIDAGAGDELVASIWENDPRTVTHDGPLLARLSWPEADPRWGVA